MKRILLISPPAYGLKDKLAYPPLGLLYLASNLDGDYELEIKNMLSLDEAFSYDYDIFGISVHSSSSYEPAKQIIKKIRNENSHTLIVVGGAFPTSMAEFTLKNIEADVVVRGEGERVFANLITAKDLSLINGITYKKDGKIIFNRLENLIEDLDTINFPARELLPRYMIRHEGRVHHSGQPATTIFATRGCMLNCSFCDTALWRRRWRSRSPDNIIAEIEEVKRKYDVHWFRFPDDCLNLNRKWFMDFCKKIATCDINWTMLSRADKLDPEMLRLMKEAGCKEIFFGFESGSQRLLDLMKKRITVEQNKKAIQMCRDVGIISCAYMMFGFPGEDEGTVRETKKFLQEARPDKSRLSQFIPVPGSDVWNNPRKYKIKIKYNFDEHWYYDSPEFALEYEYIGNKKMEELRQSMIYFYQEQGFFTDWDKPK